MELIGKEVLELFKQNNGIFALGFIDKDNFPVAYPFFAVEIGNDYVVFISQSKFIESLRNSNSIAISVFDWTGKNLIGYQLKGNATIFEAESEYGSQIIKKFQNRQMTPEFLNQIASMMDENLIIPKKEFVVKLQFNLKYSQEPKPESSKPIQIKV